MNGTDPAATLNSIQSGPICDQCNKSVRTGDKVQLYATHYEGDGWVSRRLWCENCASSCIGLETDGADEALLTAIYWNSRLVGMKITDRSLP